MHSFKVNCLRTNTMGYTGPSKGHHSSFFSIPDLTKQIKMVETIMNTKQPPSAYKVTQYLRGELFVGINSLLLSDLSLNEEDNVENNKNGSISKQLNNFLKHNS